MKIESVTQLNLEKQLVEVYFGPKVVLVGREEDPSPSELFCAGLISCSVIAAFNYCMNNHLPVPLEVETSFEVDEKTGNVTTVEMQMNVPDGFPEDRLKPLERAANTCDVKLAWQNPPQFHTVAKKTTPA